MAKIVEKSNQAIALVEKSEDNLPIVERKAEIEWTPIHTKVFEPFNRLLLVLINEFAIPFGAQAPLVIEGAKRRMNQIRDNLAPKTELEKMLVERIIVCWLESHLVDMYVSAVTDAKLKNVYLKRQASAHRRYLSSIKALAQIRKLESSLVQVNIQTNQFNSK